MARPPKVKIPIMSPEDERFLAFDGLIQWTQAVVYQAASVSAAQASLVKAMRSVNPTERLEASRNFHTECHYFVIAAHKLFEFRRWALTFGLCANVDFSELNRFSSDEVKDLRNMREHVVEYFQGDGNAKDRWITTTPEFSADASSVIGTLIGGKVDWIALGAAAERLLPQLLAQPAPHVSHP